MKKEIFEKLEALNAQNDQELIDAINNAKSLEEIVGLINAKGIAITEADLTCFTSDGELTEDALEDVAGGVVSWWPTFKGGYNDGYGGKKKNGNDFWYCLGYGVGSFLR